MVILGLTRREWRAVAGAVLLDLAVSPLFAWDVFTPVLGRELEAGDAALASVFSVGLVAFTVGVLFGGRAADMVAPRRLALLTAAGAGMGLTASAVAGTLAVLVVGYGIVFGGVTGLGYVTAVRVAGTVSARRGLALGLVVSAYAAGTIIVAPAAAALLTSVGRRWTFVVLAGLIVGCLLAAAVLVPGSPGSDASARPCTGFRARPRAGAGGGSALRIGSWGDGVSRRTGALWLLFGLGSAPALGAFAHAGDVAGNPAAPAVAVALLSAGNLAGRLLAGPLSDHVGRPAALHANAAILVVVCLVLAVGGDGVLALAALLVLGTQYGALSALTPAATADLVPAERYGSTYGFVFSGWGVAGLASPVAMAWLAARGDFRLVFVVATGVAVLAWAVTAAFTR